MFAMANPLSEFIAKKDHVPTYKEIGEFVMSKIAELGEADRKLMQDPCLKKRMSLNEY